MDILYAPWRSKYTDSVVRSKQDDAASDECVFCSKIAANDHAKHFILKHSDHCVVLLNLYPYNAGHLLILPIAHKSCITDLSSDERNELMYWSSESVRILRIALNAQGTNIGMNLGKVSGAGIPSHLHMHVLPRWAGDTNFMPLLAGTKQISFDLNEIYAKLAAAFESV